MRKGIGFVVILMGLSVFLTGAGELNIDYAEQIVVPSVEENFVPYTMARTMNLSEADSQLESRYDAREKALTTEARTQSDNLCWAYSTMSMAENNLLLSWQKEGLSFEESPDFSEDYFAYAFYYGQTEGIGDVSGDKTIPLKWYRSAGGNPVFTTFGLANGLGLVSEQAAWDEDWEQEEVDISGYVPEYEMSDAYWINFQANTNQVKQCIKDYGGAMIAMYYSTAYLNSETAGYYNYARTSMNHAVTLVGWDDEYPASAFSRDPGMDGAWLAKNNYGTQMGEDGFFWISYGDRALNLSTSKAYVFSFTKKEGGEYRYQHDGSAGVYIAEDEMDTGYRVASGGKISNVYRVPQDTPYQYQKLTKIGLALFAVNVDYEVQIYKNPKEGTPDLGEPLLEEPLCGKTRYVGYYTIPLEEEVILSAGDTFSVVVTLSKSNGADISFFVDKTYQNGDWISFVNECDYGESYATLEDDWVDLAGTEATARIKVMAEDYVVPIERVQMNYTQLTLQKQMTEKLTVSRYPENASCRQVVWSSGNESVVTVNEVGEITAHSPGVATISAKVFGDKEYVVSCEVTVEPEKTEASIAPEAEEETGDESEKKKDKKPVEQEEAPNPKDENPADDGTENDAGDHPQKEQSELELPQMKKEQESLGKVVANPPEMGDDNTLVLWLLVVIGMVGITLILPKLQGKPWITGRRRR